MYVYVCVCMCVYVCDMHMCVWKCEGTCLSMWVSVHACEVCDVCVCEHVCLCTCVCVCVCVL